MTGWIIFGSILLVLILVLIQSVTVTAVLDKEFMLTVKILCFTLVKIPADPKKKKKKKKKKPDKQKRDNNAEKNTSDDTGGTAGKPDDGGSEKTAASGRSGSTGRAKKTKKDGGINFEMIKDYVVSAWPPVKRLFKKIRFRDIYMDYVVGSDDAAKTALKYGGICAAVYALLEWMKTYFSVKIGEVNIEADFSAEKDDIFVFGRVKLRISTALVCIIWLGVRMLRTYLKYNETPKKTASRKPAGARR